MGFLSPGGSNCSTPPGLLLKSGLSGVTCHTKACFFSVETQGRRERLRFSEYPACGYCHHFPGVLRLRSGRRPIRSGRRPTSHQRACQGDFVCVFFCCNKISQSVLICYIRGVRVLSIGFFVLLLVLVLVLDKFPLSSFFFLLSSSSSSSSSFYHIPIIF